jgi:hypothetical protein
MVREEATVARGGRGGGAGGLVEIGEGREDGVEGVAGFGAEESTFVAFDGFGDSLGRKGEARGDDERAGEGEGEWKREAR